MSTRTGKGIAAAAFIAIALIAVSALVPIDDIRDDVLMGGNETVTILVTDNTTDVTSKVQTAIDSAASSGGGTVTVNGTTMELGFQLEISIPGNVSVAWNASLKSTSDLKLAGPGSFTALGSNISVNSITALGGCSVTITGNMTLVASTAAPKMDVSNNSTVTPPVRQLSIFRARALKRYARLQALIRVQSHWRAAHYG